MTFKVNVKDPNVFVEIWDMKITLLHSFCEKQSGVTKKQKIHQVLAFLSAKSNLSEWNCYTTPVANNIPWSIWK